MYRERDRPGSSTKDAESDVKKNKQDLHEKILELKKELEEYEILLEKYREGKDQMLIKMMEKNIAKTKSKLQRNEGYLQTAENIAAKDMPSSSTMNDDQNVFDLQFPGKNSKGTSSTKSKNDSYFHNDVMAFKLHQQSEKTNSCPVKEKVVQMPKKDAIRKAKNEQAAVLSLKAVEGRHHETRSVSRVIKEHAKKLSDVKETAKNDDFMNDSNATNGNTGDNGILKVPSNIQATPQNKPIKEQLPVIRKRQASTPKKAATSSKKLKFNASDEACYSAHEGKNPLIFQGCQENQKSIHENTSSNPDLHANGASNESEVSNNNYKAGGDLEDDPDDVSVGSSNEKDPDWNEKMDVSIADSSKPGPSSSKKRKFQSKSSRQHFDFAGKTVKIPKPSNSNEQRNHLYDANALNESDENGEAGEAKDTTMEFMNNSIRLIFDEDIVKYHGGPPDPSNFTYFCNFENVKFDERGKLWINGCEYITDGGGSKTLSCKDCRNLQRRKQENSENVKDLKIIRVAMSKENGIATVRGPQIIGHICMNENGSSVIPYRRIRESTLGRTLLNGLVLNEKNHILHGNYKFVRKNKRTRYHVYMCKNCIDLYKPEDTRTRVPDKIYVYIVKNKVTSIRGDPEYRHICDGKTQKLDTDMEEGAVEAPKERLDDDMEEQPLEADDYDPDYDFAEITSAAGPSSGQHHSKPSGIKVHLNDDSGPELIPESTSKYVMVEVDDDMKEKSVEEQVSDDDDPDYDIAEIFASLKKEESEASSSEEESEDNVVDFEGLGKTGLQSNEKSENSDSNVDFDDKATEEYEHDRPGSNSVPKRKSKSRSQQFISVGKNNVTKSSKANKKTPDLNVTNVLIENDEESDSNSSMLQPSTPANGTVDDKLQISDSQTFTYFCDLENVKIDEHGKIWINGHEFRPRERNSKKHVCKKCDNMQRNYRRREDERKNLKIIRVDVLKEGDNITVRGPSKIGHICMNEDGSIISPFEYLKTIVLKKPIIPGLKVNENGQIRHGGYSFVCRNEGTYSNTYICKICNYYYARKKKANLIYQSEDGLIRGKSEYHHICDGKIQKLDETNSNNDLNENIENEAEEYFRHTQNVLFETIQKLPKVEEYKTNDDGCMLFINGYEFISRKQFENGQATSYRCRACFNLYRKCRKHFQLPGKIWILHATGAVHGTPLKPLGRDHICESKDYEYYTDLYDKHDEALFKKENDRVFTKEEFLKELNNPKTIYLQLRHLLNTIKSHSTGSYHEVYAIFTRRRGTIREMFESIVWIGETFDLILRANRHKSQKLKNLIKEKNCWILPLLVCNNTIDVCKLLEALLLDIISKNEFPVAPKQLYNTEREKIHDEELRKWMFNADHEYDVEHVRMRNGLVQLIHAAIRMDNFVSVQDARNTDCSEYFTGAFTTFGPGPKKRTKKA